MKTEISTYEQQAIDFLTATKTTLSFTYDGFKKYFDEDKQKRNVFNWSLFRHGETVTGKFGSSISDSCKETPILLSDEVIEIYSGISTPDPNTSMHDKKRPKIYLSCSIKVSCIDLNKIKNGRMPAEQLLPIKEMEQSYASFIAYYKKAKVAPKGMASSFDSFKNYVVQRIETKITELEAQTVLLDQADQIIEPSAYDLLCCLVKYDPGTFENFCADYGYDTDSRRAEKIYKNTVNEWVSLGKLYTSAELERLAEIS